MVGRTLARLYLVLVFLLASCQSTSTGTPSPVEPSPRPVDTFPAIPTQTPLKNIDIPYANLRSAIAYCTDRSALVRSVYPWIADPESLYAISFLPPSHWAYMTEDAVLSRYPFSPQRGQTLLDEMGWSLPANSQYRVNANGEILTLTLTTTELKLRQAWTAVWQDQMANCGIRIVHQSVPANWLFGAETGLSHRDFDLAAFAVSSYPEFFLVKMFSCDQIPDTVNGWQGQNFSGWCNLAVQESIRRLAGTVDQADQRAAYQTIQREFGVDLPVLPLFYWASVFAVNPALENFSPPDDGIHTWNAAHWRIPGKDIIIIGSDGEPAGLDETAYIAKVISTLVNGIDAVRVGGRLHPVLLLQIPSLENGQVVEQPVIVREGDQIVDASGNPVQLAPGMVVQKAQGERVQYSGGDIELRQLVVDFIFRQGLTWSDGVPVTKADYELGYRVERASSNPDACPACKVIAEVEFLSDTQYRVRWKPGYDGISAAAYDLPPFRRVPAHHVLSDGRKLAEIPPGEWHLLEEMKRFPLGVGPYVLKNWTYGKSMILEANPYYFGGPVTTSSIMIRFLEHDQAIAALLNGEIDVLDWETIGPNDVDDFHLAKAHDERQIRLVLDPSSLWEQVTFNLTD